MKITNKEIEDLLRWLEYEYSLTTEHDRTKKGFTDLTDSGRIAMEKYAAMLEKLGYTSLKDWHERE